MKRSIRKRTITITAISLILVAISAMWIFYPYHYVLSFHKQSTDELLSYIPIEDQERFEIRYTHSIHLSEVRELFRVKEGKMKLEKLIYEDTAIGMPSNAQKGDTFRMEDGKYIIEKSEKAEPFPYINMSVGQVKAKHKVIYQGHKKLLKKYVGAGTNIQIDVEHMNNWQLWRGVNMLE